MATISLDAPSITFIYVFTVAPENQQRLRDLLDTATAPVMQQLSGFVSAHRHQSQDGTRVVHYAQWKSQAAFEAMLPNPGAQRHMAEAVGVYDQTGRIIQCNRAYRELFATERLPGLEAMPLVDRAPLFDMRDATTGEPLPLERFPVTRALRGEAHTGPSADIRIRALDGREVEANLSAAPLRDGAGGVVGAVSVIHDIAWRRRLEREREVTHAH